MDNRWIDPEIEGMFDGDPELTELAHRVRAARPEPPLDPRFEGVLRAQLMREAPAVLGAGAKPDQAASGRPRTIRTRRTGWWQRSPRFAWGGAFVGAALVAAAVFSVAKTPVQDHQVTASSAVADFHAVSPNNVITVAFNQPMNHSAVVAGLHIRPATQVTTSWQGNKLLITPTHHLAGNTPYTVTIDRNAARSAGGTLAASDIHIAFGTAPTPPPTTSVAELSPDTLSSVTDKAALVSGGNGTVIATASTAVAASPSASTSPSASPSSSVTPSPQPSTSPSPSPSPLPSASAAPSASAVPSSTGELVAMSAGGNVTDLGPAASSAALAPNGLRLVAAVPTTTGTAIELVAIDGSDRRTLAKLASTVVGTGWLSSNTALVAEPDRIVTVDLLGHVGTLTTLPAGTTRVVFSTGGGAAFAGSTSADGQLIDLATHQSRPLSGSRDLAAFSGDGLLVAWIDSTASPARLLTSPVDRAAAATVPLDHPADSIAGITMDRTGTHVAITDQPSTDGGELQLLSLPSGTVVAHAASARAPVYSSQGNRIAYISGGTARIARVPGVVSGTILNALPDGAAGVLKAFVDAQIQHNTAALATLSGTDVDAVGSTPHKLSRGYVISAVANVDGTVSATARLIVDPSAEHPDASFADESMLLAPRDGGGYVVATLSGGLLSDEPIGPQVLSVVPVTGTTLVLRVSFDSDLRPDSVAGAITVTTPSGRTLVVVTTYDPNTRTATVTTTVPASTSVRLTVKTSLVDVDGQSLATAFTAPTAG